MINGCSDFSSKANEFEISGQMYACDKSIQGDVVNDTKTGKKQYCNGQRWIDLISEDSVVQDISNIPVMYECNNGIIAKFKDLCSTFPKEYLPLDDSEYPYAGIPRIVIETENHRAIKDRETEIPAKLQIWGKYAPESEIMDLTIRGRGNSSWFEMPKKSYKIEFANKQAILGMSKEKDWALIANFADKSLLKNFITYKLSSWLKADFSPNCKFIELYINRNFLGTYLLTENIKVSQNRVNISKDNKTFLCEYDIHYKKSDQVLVLKDWMRVTVHFPQDISYNTKNIIINHLDSITSIIKNTQLDSAALSNLFNLEDYLRFYWIQEFSSNRDGNFDTSVFFTWQIGTPVKMGPLWDFDLGYKGQQNPLTQNPEAWFIRNYYWNIDLFKNVNFVSLADNYWRNNRKYFIQTLDSIPIYHQMLSNAAINNFKRWDILNSTESKFHQESFKNYDDAVSSLLDWITTRIQWFDKNTTNYN